MSTRHICIIFLGALCIAALVGLTYGQRPKRLTFDQLLDLPIEQLMEVRIASNMDLPPKPQPRPTSRS